MTAEEFEQLFGQRPIQDDLERVNCPIVGGLGHFQCGVCPAHEKPRFMCGCVATSSTHPSPVPVKCQECENKTTTGICAECAAKKGNM